MKRTLCFLALNCYLGFCFHLNQTFAQMPGPPIIDTPLTMSKAYFYNGEIIVPYSNGHVSVTNNAAVNILSTTEVTLLPGFTASVDSGCREFVAGVQECPVLTIAALAKDITCHGAVDGRIIVYPSGGTAPYYYVWSPNIGASASIFSLASGDYSVTVTDQNGCTASVTKTVNEPTELIATSQSTPSNCHFATGTATITASGGNGDYSYIWLSEMLSSNYVEHLSAGSYKVQVIDKKFCSKLISINISDSAGPSVNVNVLSNVTCFGGADGRVEVSLPYPGPDPIFQTNINPDRLHAGTYPVIQADSNGCVTIVSVDISEPPPLDLRTSVISSICGRAFGGAQVVASGGTGSYSFNWSSGSTDSMANDLFSGIYTVTVTDENGCSINSTVIISDSGSFSVSSDIHNMTCSNIADGSIQLSVTGGNPPYTYLWNDYISETNSATGLSLGTYTITISDNAGCKMINVDSISSPMQIIVDEVIEKTSSDESCDGRISLLIMGGTPPYIVDWGNGIFGDSILNLCNGTYTYTISDESNCQRQGVIQLNSILESVQTSCSQTTPPDFQNLLSACQTCHPENHGVDLDIVRDFGAIPNDLNSDEQSFEFATSYIMANCTTGATLAIPAGTYIVGRQTINHNPLPGEAYAHGHDILCFDGCTNLSIIGIPDANGHNPVIRFADCMLYGSFDYTTGERYLPWSSHCVVNPDSCSNFSRYKYAAFPGQMINIINSSNVTISHLELDGNCDRASVGGYWASDLAGINLGYTGIWLNQNNVVNLNDLNVHHFGYDALIIADQRTGLNIDPIDIRISRSKFNWNCRDGVSWISGNGVSFFDCEFNFNGYGMWDGTSFRSGIDLEYEGGQDVQNGVFNNCKFKYNKTAGVISDPGHIAILNKRNFQFMDCEFVSGPQYCVYPGAPKMEFTSCNFYGPITGAYDGHTGTSAGDGKNLKFYQCTFNEVYEDFDSTVHHPYAHTLATGTCSSVDIHPFMLELSDAGRALFDGCEFNTNYFNEWARFNRNYIANPGWYRPYDFSVIKNCIFRNAGIAQNWLGIWRELGIFQDVDFIQGSGNSAYVVQEPSNCSCTIGYRLFCFWTNACPTYCLGNLPMVTGDGNGVCLPNWNCSIANLASGFIPDLGCTPKFDDSAYRSNYWQIFNGCNQNQCYVLATPECIYCGNPPCIPNGSKIAISNDSHKSGISLSPIPTSELLTIHDTEIGQTIEIYNFTGALILKQSVHDDFEIIDVSKFAVGGYFLRVYNQTKSSILKFSKL